MSNNSKVVESLKKVLADTYTLYLKTQYYHWNVTGPNFYSYHKMFEDQYTELADAVDDVAEEIRTVGAKSPGSFREFLDTASVSDNHVDGKASDMIKDLVKSHETIIESLKELKSEAAAIGSRAEDMADDRILYHQKTVWMLNSSVE